MLSKHYKRIVEGWRATRHSYICSNHLKNVIMLYYYVRKRPAGKKNAVPSLFKLLSPSLPNHNIPEKARSWSEVQCRQNVTHENNTLLMKKFPCHQPKFLETTTMQNQKIKYMYHQKSKIQKSQIRNWKVKWRTYSSKITKMADIMNDLQRNIITALKVRALADELHTTFDKLKLSIFYNTKNNTKWHCEKVIQKGRASNRYMLSRWFCSKISEYSHTILMFILESLK